MRAQRIQRRTIIAQRAVPFANSPRKDFSRGFIGGYRLSRHRAVKCDADHQSASQAIAQAILSLMG